MTFLYLIYELFINVRGDFLNKNNIERPEKFNQREYDKTHFKQFNVKIKPDLWEDITDYCNNMNISKSDFLRRAIEALKNQ